jgi:hypothetical protein
MMTSDYHVTLESAVLPGSHIGILPSGQLSDPTQTNKMTDAAHFKVKYLVSNIDSSYLIGQLEGTIITMNEDLRIHE